MRYPCSKTSKVFRLEKLRVEQMNSRPQQKNPGHVPRECPLSLTDSRPRRRFILRSDSEKQPSLKLQSSSFFNSPTIPVGARVVPRGVIQQSRKTMFHPLLHPLEISSSITFEMIFVLIKNDRKDKDTYVSVETLGVNRLSGGRILPSV